MSDEDGRGGRAAGRRGISLLQAWSSRMLTDSLSSRPRCLRPAPSPHNLPTSRPSLTDPRPASPARPSHTRRSSSPPTSSRSCHAPPARPSSARSGRRQASRRSGTSQHGQRSGPSSRSAAVSRTLTDSRSSSSRPSEERSSPRVSVSGGDLVPLVGDDVELRRRPASHWDGRCGRSSC